jgi:hypothetical protein
VHRGDCSPDGEHLFFGTERQDLLRDQAGDGHLYGGPNQTRRVSLTNRLFRSAGQHTVYPKKRESSPRNFSPSCKHMVRGSGDSRWRG